MSTAAATAVANVTEVGSTPLRKCLWDNCVNVQVTEHCGFCCKEHGDRYVTRALARLGEPRVARLVHETVFIG
jgi:hypothetical protein